METIESLRRKITSAEDLHGVVKTMKALAAVSIRQYEKAVESLTQYAGSVEMGFQILLQKRPSSLLAAEHSLDNSIGAIVFGSDQGMVGQFNGVIASHAIEELKTLQTVGKRSTILAVGLRVLSCLQEAGQEVAEWTSLPGSMAAVTSAVQDMVLRLEAWQSQEGIRHIVLFHNRPKSGASYDPGTARLLPVDPKWFQSLAKRRWPCRSLPQYKMESEPLFSSLIREYLFIALYRRSAELMTKSPFSKGGEQEEYRKFLRFFFSGSMNAVRFAT